MTTVSDLTLWEVGGTGEAVAEDQRFLKQQLITYIGNKRRLLHTLDESLKQVRKRLGKNKLRMLDAFSGSGVVSRFFKQHSELLISNDLERYAGAIGACYLTNRSSIDFHGLAEQHKHVVDAAEALPVRDGFIRRLYAPKSDDSIQPGERVFYSSANAMRIDSIRKLIDDVPQEYQVFLLAPLLSEASIHNTPPACSKASTRMQMASGNLAGTTATP